MIVGAGTAGLNAIRTLRQLGDKGEITLVSAERPYSRMVLPYYLDGSITEAHTATATEALMDSWGVTRLFGRTAAKLNGKASQLKLDNGDVLEYDNLLIATGSTAARPPIKGAGDPDLYTFWTMDDARGVNGVISESGHTVVVGAGFIAFTILNGRRVRMAFSPGVPAVTVFPVNLIPECDESTAHYSRTLHRLHAPLEGVHLLFVHGKADVIGIAGAGLARYNLYGLTAGGGAVASPRLPIPVRDDSWESAHENHG